jgi:molybdopterin/thiamine biosynthesis adenylyltransferase
VTPGWHIVDGDEVDVSNLNRQLIFLAAHAGYPQAPPVKKAEAAASALGAQYSTNWYGSEVDVVEDAYDVVLALANEHGARSLLQARQPTVLLHATTSTTFGAQFHRHISGIDDCIECRLPPAILDLGCGGGTVQVGGRPVDAAIGHLSAAAGLLLLAGLVRLQLGQLANLSENKVDLTLEGVTPYVQVAQVPACQTDCHMRLPPSGRSALAADERFAALDPRL